MTDLERLAAGNRDKARRAIDRVTASLVASLADSQAFDPRINYTPKAPEPYDALADRFVRPVECCLRYFRSHELAEFAEQSDTPRNLLNRMEKLRLVGSASLWLEMRNIRNRIVHDYLPEQTAQMFDLIAKTYGPELLEAGKQIAGA